MVFRLKCCVYAIRDLDAEAKGKKNTVFCVFCLLPVAELDHRKA